MERKYKIGSIIAFVILLFVLAFVFLFQGRDEVIQDDMNSIVFNCYPLALRVDGKIYLYSSAVELAEEEIANYEISGMIETAGDFTEVPTQDNRANFSAAEGAYYIKFGENLAVLIDDIWYLCEYSHDVDT